MMAIQNQQFDKSLIMGFIGIIAWVITILYPPIGGIIAIIVVAAMYFMVGSPGGVFKSAGSYSGAMKHCGFCGSPIRLEMAFCPKCGKQQAA